MRVIFLVLLSLSAYSQVSVPFVESVINHKSIVSDSLTLKAVDTSNSINLQYITTGDYAIFDDGLYKSLTTYLGEQQKVESEIIEDRLLFSGAKNVFIHSSIDFFTGNNLVMVYTFDR